MVSRPLQPCEAVLTGFEALDLERLPFFNSIEAAKFGWNHHLPFARNSYLHNK